MIIPLLRFKVNVGYSFQTITIQYPKRKYLRRKLEGIQYFEKDERGKTKCVGCGLCMRSVLPNVFILRLLKMRRETISTTYELMQPMYLCGIAKRACPVNAIFLERL